MEFFSKSLFTVDEKIGETDFVWVFFKSMVNVRLNKVQLHEKRDRLSDPRKMIIFPIAFSRGCLTPENY